MKPISFLTIGIVLFIILFLIDPKFLGSSNYLIYALIGILGVLLTLVIDRNLKSKQ